MYHPFPQSKYSIFFFILLCVIVLAAIQNGFTQYVFVHEFDGVAPAKFNSPTGITIDIHDNVYISDSKDFRIQCFTSEGEFIGKWGRQGGYGYSGALNTPQGLAIDRIGNVYVADTDHHQIEKFTFNGVRLTAWGGGYSGSSDPGKFNRPYDVALDSAGNFYVADTENDRIQKFDANGKFLTAWGTDGSGNGQFNNPEGICVSRDGYLYVADTYNHRIQKFTLTGNFIGKWGSYGTGKGQLINPAAIAIDQEGNVYVAEKGNHRISKFKRDGSFLISWGAQGSADGMFKNPNGIAINSMSEVYVVDSDNHRIQKFTANGIFLKKWGEFNSGKPFYDPEGVAVGDNGYVYVADTENDLIQGFDPNIQFYKKWGTGDYPSGVAVDGAGNVYVSGPDGPDSGSRTVYSSAHKVTKYTQSGSLIKTIATWGSADGQVSWPSGVAVNNQFLYVVDTNNDRIQKFDLDGKFVKTWKSGDGNLSGPQGAAVDLQGNIYVADTRNNRVVKFDAEGNFLFKWGGYGSDAAKFDNPEGIAVDKFNNVYVADSRNHRIQKFTGNGAFLSQWGGYGSVPGKLLGPSGVAVDHKGNVYVADSGNDRVQIFAPDGYVYGVDPKISSVYAMPIEIKADGLSRSTITVIPKDWLGNPIGAGQTVSLQTTLGTLLDKIVDHGDGTYSQQLQSSSKQDTAIVAATVNGIEILQKARVIFKSFNKVSLKIDLTDNNVFLELPFTTEVKIENVTNLGAFEFEISYPTPIIQADSAWISPFLGSTGRQVSAVGPKIDNSSLNGCVTFGGFSFGTQAGPSGNNTLAFIRFAAMDTGLANIEINKALVTNTSGESQFIEKQTGKQIHISKLPADPDSSMIWAEPDLIPPDGTSTTEVIVIPKNRLGKKLGIRQQVVLNTTAGTLTGAITDVGEGTYKQQLRSTTIQGIAVVTAMVNGINMTHKAMVKFKELPKITLKVEPGDTTVTVNEFFNIRILADSVLSFKSAKFKLIYNSKIVAVDSIFPGSFIIKTGRKITKFDTSIEHIDTIRTSLSLQIATTGDQKGAEGSGHIARLKYSAQGLGHTILTFSDVEFEDTYGRKQNMGLQQHGNINVVPARSVPEIISTPEDTTVEDDFYIYKILTTGYPIPVTELVEFPPGMIFKQDSSIIKWQPDNANVGQHNISIKCTNSVGQTSQNFMLTVLNNNPKITSQPVMMAYEDKEYRYDVQADDEGQAATSYVLKSGPDWLALDKNNGVLNGTPTQKDTGFAIVAITFDDGNGGTAEQRFNLRIENVNDAPIVSGIPDLYFRSDSAVVLLLDDYVNDEDHSRSKMNWTKKVGNENLKVLIDDNRKATLSSQTWTGTTSVIFIATDPLGASGSDTITVKIEPPLGINDQSSANIPTDFRVLGNYPNPFNSETAIHFELPEDCEVTLEIFTIAGTRVAYKNLGLLKTGLQRYTWRAADFPSGAYIYKIQALGISINKKMLLLK